MAELSWPYEPPRKQLKNVSSQNRSFARKGQTTYTGHTATALQVLALQVLAVKLNRRSPTGNRRCFA